jgi:hypothetical protein
MNAIVRDLILYDWVDIYGLVSFELKFVNVYDVDLIHQHFL